MAPTWKPMSGSGDTNGCGMSFRPSTGMGDTKTSLFLDAVTTGLACSLLLRLFLGCLDAFIDVVVIVGDAARILFL